MDEEIFHFAAPREERALSKEGPLRDMLFDGTASDLVRLFAVPVPLQHTTSPSEAWQMTAPDGDNALTLLKLPADIHYLIFDALEFIDDVVCLGLTNRTFVCVGEEVKPDEYPAGLFSAEEIDELRPFRTNLRHDGGGWYVLCNTPLALSHFADDSVSTIDDFVDPMDEAWRLLQRCKSLGESKDPAVAARGWWIMPRESTFFPRDQPWILRNLTTKEFVRAEAIAIKPEYVRGPDILVVGFGEVIMFRTCWSSARSNVYLANNTKYGRPWGVWAGHRLDITTRARHESGKDSAEWRDVSDEVARELAEIWHHRFGADIREDLAYWYSRRPNREHFDTRPP
ncbi:hypothetical protein F5Y14DRAFT_466139 [Nemania sp. NC0429]|nr:hypothetical protein F5Y14DRAFT_466139 [Nemania sp. NC0429]